MASINGELEQRGKGSSLNLAFVSAPARLGPDRVCAHSGSPRSCWRQSRRTLECLWAPDPWYLERQKAFRRNCLLSCRKSGSGEPHVHQTSSFAPPGVISCQYQRVPSLLSSCLAPSSTTQPDDGHAFFPRAGASDTSSTSLVQAVPHASRLRQRVCGQGLAMVGAFTPPVMHCCVRPHARLALYTGPERCGLIIHSSHCFCRASFALPYCDKVRLWVALPPAHLRLALVLFLISHPDPDPLLNAWTDPIAWLSP